MSLKEVVDFHSEWYVAEMLIGGVIVVLCSRFQHTKWIVPFWSLFVIATGLHTIAPILAIISGAFAGPDGGWMGLTVMYYMAMSWPVSLTFVLLLVVRPRAMKRRGVRGKAAERDDHSASDHKT